MAKENYRSMSQDELVRKRADLRTELRKLRFQSVSGRIANPLQLRTLRRNIARINTFLRQRELQAERGAQS